VSGAADPFRSGAAREVPKGRLASFEDAPAPTFALPPRPGQARKGAPGSTERDVEEAPAARKDTGSVDAGSLDAGSTDVNSADGGSVVEESGHDGPDTSTTPVPVPSAGTGEAAGPVRASNVHIPAELLDAFNAAKASQKLSNGELIITAIEATYEELQRQLRPPSATGGSLFAPRVSRPPRLPAKGPVTPVNYRLRPDDYATLDRLVRDLGASSRSHLISEALRTYLSRTT